MRLDKLAEDFENIRGKTSTRNFKFRAALSVVLLYLKFGFSVCDHRNSARSSSSLLYKWKLCKFNTYFACALLLNERLFPEVSRLEYSNYSENSKPKTRQILSFHIHIFTIYNICSDQSSRIASKRESYPYKSFRKQIKTRDGKWGMLQNIDNLCKLVQMKWVWLMEHNNFWYVCVCAWANAKKMIPCSR